MQLAHAMIASFDQYSDRPALAERRPVPRSNEDIQALGSTLRDHYESVTYRELSGRVLSVATQFTRTGPALEAGDTVAFLGYAGIDYVTADLACNMARLVTVPLQTSSSADQQRTILSETTPRAIAVSSPLLERAATLVIATPSIERVIVLDHRGGNDEHVRRLENLTEAQPLRPATLDLSQAPFAGSGTSAEDDPAMLLYTSGSTGAPKGAIYPERLVTAMWGGAGWSEFFAQESAVSNFHYMPMSHVAGHSSVRSTLARGGLTHFASSYDLSTFFDDLRLAAPTELSLVPRICAMIHQEHQRRLQAERARALDAGSPDESLDESVRATMRTEIFGGKVSWASCTSAPLSPQLKKFMEELLEIEVHELYGTTEIGGVLSDGAFLCPPVIDHRLEDIPELGYYSSDRPDARGELLVKSRSTIPGYFRRPDLNERIFTADGYYRTGDIAARDATGAVRIIDRKNAVIKLSQGEFVAIPSLEVTYVSRSPLLRQAFLYGDSSKTYILAVAVPSPELIEEHAGDTAAMRDHLLGEFRRIAAELSLNSYEIPRDLLVETEPFTESNGLLSDHRKLVRPELHRRYGAKLGALYDRLEAASQDRLKALRTTAGHAPTLDTVTAAIRITLGGTPETVPPTARFRDLGGDSLSAVELSRLLEDVLGVRVPVNTIASESHDIERLARTIDSRLRSGRTTPTPGRIHRRADVLSASDLALSHFLGETFTPAPPASAGSRADGHGTALVTGANGFLGRFLCLELLRHASASDGRVVCLVRATDDAAARARLRTTFATDDGLLEEFDRLSTRLEVVAGDLGEPELGLAPETWQRLAHDVDHIFHAGAMVNHALPYDELFDVNVAGTAEVVRLAATARRTPVVFVSSIATALLATDRPALDEDADIRHGLPEIALQGRNVEGYAVSKWAGEVLLRAAHDELGLPVTVIRASMILAHSRFRGQINVPDTFSRLLYSLALTGVAPASFYADDGARAHYDGLPVDVVAASIVDIARARPAGHATYHVVNPLDDGVSLDSFVGWLDDAGLKLTRIDDHGDWFQRFRSGLHALDERERQASVLPLLENFTVPEPAVRGSMIVADRFTEHLRARGRADRIRSLDAQFAAKSLADLETALGRTFRT